MSEKQNKKGFTVKDKRKIDSKGNAMPDTSKTEVLNDTPKKEVPKAMPARGKIAEADDILLKDNERHSAKLFYTTMQELAKCNLGNQNASNDLRYGIKKAVLEYFKNNIYQANISPDNAMGNEMFVQAFERYTGMTDGVLEKVLKDGQEVSANSGMGLGQNLLKTFGEATESLAIGKLQKLLDTANGRKDLEEIVSARNKQYNLGIEDYELKDSNGLIRGYMQGIRKIMEEKYK